MILVLMVLVLIFWGFMALKSFGIKSEKVLKPITLSKIISLVALFCNTQLVRSKKKIQSWQVSFKTMLLFGFDKDM